jgi:hypothetical protein
MRLTSVLLFVLSLMTQGKPAQAQAPQGTTASTGKVSTSGYEIGVHAGPFLPSKIKGVTEVMNATGFRLGMGNDSGKWELDTLFARGEGQEYKSAQLDYRYNLPSQLLDVHALFGVHADQYASPGRPTATSGGAHIGAGVSFAATANFGLRTDFKFRIAPGTSLYVGVGLWILIPRTGGAG